MELKERTSSWIFQAGIIATVAGIFMSAACINKRNVAGQYWQIFAFTVTADFLLLLFWIWETKKGIKRLGSGFCQYSKQAETILGICLVLGWGFATRAIQLWDTPRWDALTYYTMLISACENFDFKFLTFLQDFSLASHPTLAYAGLAAIGEFLWPKEYTGVLLVQLFLHLLTGFFLYKIFEKIFPEHSWIRHTFSACLVLTTPMVLGTFSYFHPDAGTIYFFIFMLFCYLYKKNLLLLFSMLLLVQTKEIGSLVIFGFVGGVFLNYMISQKQKQSFLKSFIGFLKEPLAICSMIAAISIGLYFGIYLKTGGEIWNIPGKDGSGFSTIRLIPDFFAFKWKQYFFLNFNWLIWIGIFFSAAILIYKKVSGRMKEQIKYREIAIGIFAVILIQMLFYSIYITYTLPRYHVLIDCGSVFLLTFLVGNIWRNTEKFRIKERFKNSVIPYMIMLLWGGMMLLEAYVTVDPISLRVFDSQDTGHGKILRCDYEGEAIQRDYCVYNYQYTYLNKAYNQVLKDVDYHEGMDVLIWNNNTNDQIFGDYFWDTEKRRRTLKTGDNAIPIRGIEREMIDKQEILLQPEAVFVLSPQFIITEKDAEDYLHQYYEIRYKGFVIIPFGGKVTYYVCDLVKQIEVGQ